MAIFLEAANESSFVTSNTYDQGASPFATSWQGGGNTAPHALQPASSTTVNSIWLKITDWDVVTELKALIYEDGSLVETITIPSSVGTGLIQVDAAGTLTALNTSYYQIAIHINAQTTLFEMPTASGLAGFRSYNQTGTYASPAASITNGTYQTDEQFYWAFDDAAVSGGISVTQSDTTPEDGVQQSFTTTGLTGTITAATLGGYDILSLLSDTDPTTATTYTLDISAIEASQGAPRIGQTSTLSITATGGTATTDVVIQPKTGWAEVDLAGTLNKDAGGFLALLDSTLGLTSAVGDIIYYDASSNAAITAAGVYTSDLTTAGQNTPFVIQQGGSATSVSTSEGGAFYPYGEAGGGSNVPKTKYRRFPWQPWNPL